LKWQRPWRSGQWSMVSSTQQAQIMLTDDLMQPVVRAPARGPLPLVDH
jgi:hypothetical protein